MGKRSRTRRSLPVSPPTLLRLQKFTPTLGESLRASGRGRANQRESTPAERRKKEGHT
jgi:hypothetical protein